MKIVSSEDESVEIEGPHHMKKKLYIESEDETSVVSSSDINNVNFQISSNVYTQAGQLMNTRGSNAFSINTNKSKFQGSR